MATSEVETPQIVDVSGAQTRGSWFSWLPSWKPTSAELLEEAENTVFKELSSPYEDRFVPVGPDAHIRTLIMQPQESTEEELAPLVLIHGFGCGIPQFYKNIDHLHAKRHLYAIDLPGFARSSRVEFPKEPDEIEQQFVEYIENWREGVGLKQFILLGHSLGAFISCTYAMQYPSRVRHLIMVDPWGVAVRPANPEGSQNLPKVVTVATYFMTMFNPLSPVRAAGPLGPYLVSRFRPDLARKFGDDFMTYVYHANAQNPSGENAYFHLQVPFAWARRPLLERIGTELDPDIPLSLLYGMRSWMDCKSGEKVQELRPNSHVTIRHIRRAGHHIHAEQPEIFNKVINGVCSLVDSNRDRDPVASVATDLEGLPPEEGEF